MGPTREGTTAAWPLYEASASRSRSGSGRGSGSGDGDGGGRWCSGEHRDAGRDLADAGGRDENYYYRGCDYWAEEDPIEDDHHQSQSQSQSHPPSLSASASSASSASASLLRTGGGSGLSRSEQKAATICACFLRDYEGGQPPTLSSDFAGITRFQLLLYRVKHSVHWNLFGRLLATVLLFVPSCGGKVPTLLAHAFSIMVFAADLCVTDQFLPERDDRGPQQQQQQQQLRADAGGGAGVPGRLLFRLMRGFLCLMCLQTITDFFFAMGSDSNNENYNDNENNYNNDNDNGNNDNDNGGRSMAHAFSLGVSVLKPVVFFYQSRRARDALEALARISKKLVRVILIELFLILVFAAVASRLYYEYEDFESLPKAWLSLFALSTTVVNPSIWMPTYYQSPWNAVFFVIFIIVSIFYLHSLVLSVVFQVFIQSVTEVHRQSATDKENSLKLAFLALTSAKRDRSNKNHNNQNNNNKNNNNGDLSGDENAVVDVRLILEAFRLLRPHYSRQKLDVLTEIILPRRFENASSVELRRGGPGEGDENRTRADADANANANKHTLGYGEFRNRIRQALGSSVRTTRTHSALGMAVEVLSVFVAIVNFLYVLIFASRVRPHERNFKKEFFMGSVITLLTLCEMGLRYNPRQFRNRINPITRINAVLDGMGCLGGIVSLFGMVLHLAIGHENGLEYLLIGRAIGMIQSMRFSVWFREVLQRSLYVLPFLAGPIFLILTAVHIFVYVGMALWEGAVDVEEQASNENVQYLYYLNNFNSYGEGCITVFNVLVVNDWHQIANVFLYADRFSSPFAVYLYFVLLVIVAVCILLNVIVAFFVETFVTHLKLVDAGNEPEPDSARSVATANTSTVFRSDVSLHIAPIARSWIFDASDLKKTSVRSLSCPDTGEKKEFDVIRREGFDDIIQSVGNNDNDDDDEKQFEEFARGVLDALELVQNLAPEWNTNTNNNTTINTNSNNNSSTMGHVLCCLQNELRFQSKNLSPLARDYFAGEDDLRRVIRELRDVFASASPKSPERVRKSIPHLSDPSKELRIGGALLPGNGKSTPLLLTATVHQWKQTPEGGQTRGVVSETGCNMNTDADGYKSFGR